MMEATVKTGKQQKIKYKKKMNKSDKVALWASRVVIWLMIISVIFPIMAIVAASMGTGNAFSQGTIFPKQWSVENYAKVITDTDFMIWVKNSMIVCCSTALLQLVMTIPAAFAFSKLRFTGRKNGLMMLLILQMFPAAMSFTAIITIAYKLNLMDHLWALILVQCAGSAYNIWLMKGTIDGIPNEITEAAYVDGATTWQVFVKIIMPLIRNMILVIFVFAFVGAYSEFMFTAALMKDTDKQTVASGMRSFIKDQFSQNWTQFAAAAIMASVPVVAITMIGQKFMASGLVAGSVKG